MRKGLFWLNDKQWAQIKPHLPTNQTGPEREDDRRIISGIIHMLQCGARWRDCPPDFGPYTTIYNRSEEHTSELQSQSNLVCRLLLEKKNAVGPRSVHA